MTRLDSADEALDSALPHCPSCLHPMAPHPRLTAWLCGHCGFVQL